MCRCSHTPMLRSMTKRVFYRFREVSQAHGLGVFHRDARNKITDQLIEDILQPVTSAFIIFMSLGGGVPRPEGVSGSEGQELCTQCGNSLYEQVDILSIAHQCPHRYRCLYLLYALCRNYSLCTQCKHPCPGLRTVRIWYFCVRRGGGGGGGSPACPFDSPV